jgi:hypothetical protein
MFPQTKTRPPGRGAGPDDRPGGHHVEPSVPRRSPGCPCGCRTRLPWIDDPECVRHQPFAYDLELYERAGAVA